MLSNARPMRTRTLHSLLAATLLATGLAGCDLVPEELGGTPDESPTPTGSATPTPTGTPDPDPTPVVTTNGDIVTFDFGTVSLPAGESPTFALTVPSGAIGIDFIINGAAADAAKIFAFFSMEAPNNRTVIDNSTNGPVRQGFNNGVMSFSVPADDGNLSVVVPGVWTFHVAAFNPTSGALAASNPQVLVKVRTASGGTVPNGLVDMNVIVVEGSGINATQAAASGSEVQLAITHMDALYSTIGLGVGDVAFYDLQDASFAIVSSETEMQTLFEQSGDASLDQRVNLFIVGDLQGDLNGAAGIAGGIPIPMDMNGTIHSGVVIFRQGSGTLTGEVMAHEVGHSLGMYHSTEFDGSTDPITDTVSCAAATIGSNPGACPDSNNVMFPQVTGGFDSFSTGQGAVLRPTVHVRNPGTPAFAPAGPRPIPPRDILPGERVLNCRRVGSTYVIAD